MVKTLFLVLVIVFFAACGDAPPKITYTKAKDKTTYQNKLIQANRGLVEQDADSIVRFLKHKKWNMQEHGRGLWYEILTEGRGEKAKKEMVISLKYKLSLLDETLLYCSDSLGLKTFKVGHGGVETGLEDAVLLLNKGAKAKIILPPHLAHGLTGDNQKIPPRAILLYELEVVDLKKAEE